MYWGHVSLQFPYKLGNDNIAQISNSNTPISQQLQVEQELFLSPLSNELPPPG